MRYDSALERNAFNRSQALSHTCETESNMSGFANKAVGRLLACWGNGDYGRLGHGLQCFPETIPRVCSALTDLRMASVACGGAHTVAIADTGAAFSMGLNENGQLGHSTNVQFVPVPQQMLLCDAVKQVAAGHHHTMLLTSSGDIWTCGRNTRGQLGLGGKSGSSVGTPQRVEALVGTKIVSIAAGAEHSVAVSQEGQLFSWGCSTNGRLGHPQTNRGLWHRARDEYTPRLVQGMTEKVVHAACGHMHSGCIDSDGNVHTWGYGAFWQLGSGKNADQGQPLQVLNVHSGAQLGMGGAHTLALGQAGTISTWGSNNHGALGLGVGTSSDAHEPVRLPKLSCSQVAAGWKHSAALGQDGQLYTWGWGGSVGSTTNLESGHSSGGQLGLGNEFDYWGATQVTDLQTGADMQSSEPVWKAMQVSCGFNHTAAIVEIDSNHDLMNMRT